MNEKDVEILYNKQRTFFDSGKTRDTHFRIDQLRKLYHIIDENTKEILHSLFLDLNKSSTESFTSEIMYALIEIKALLRNIKKWSRPVKVKTPILNKPGKSFYIYEPYGTALIISPWNYPFGLLITPLAGAIASGNCIIGKPSEQAPSTSACIKRLIDQNFDEAYIAIVEGGAEDTQSLIRPGTGCIFFTGSTGVGRKIMASASNYLIPVILELGGKNPCIVDDDINLDTAVRRIAWGKFFNAGQTCVAPDYLMVHRNIKDKFLNKLKSTIKDFYETRDPVKDFTRIINRKHYDRLSGLLNKGDIIAGGNTDEERLYISPTVLDNMDFDSRIMQEEIFGPVLPVITYDNLASALDHITKRDRPLITYFFSNDKRKQKLVMDRANSGSVCINGTLHIFLSNELPFGGAGASGMGRYHGFASYEAFTYKKAVLQKSLSWDIKTFYPPYKTPLKFLKKIMDFIY